MTVEEYQLINSICSQLEHYVDQDGKQKSEIEIRRELDNAEAMVMRYRGQLIRERDFGHRQSDN